MLLQPNKKSTKRLREVLSQLYIHLDNSALQSAHDVSKIAAFWKYLIEIKLYSVIFISQNVDIPGLVFGQSEYYPYVYYKINIDMIDVPGKI
jgi:V-type H+-transporting ATPase subunit C